jgi:hypothetical protein
MGTLETTPTNGDSGDGDGRNEEFYKNIYTAIGEHYKSGLGTQQNPEKAKQYFEKGAGFTLSGAVKK